MPLYGKDCTRIPTFRIILLAALTYNRSGGKPSLLQSHLAPKTSILHNDRVLCGLLQPRIQSGVTKHCIVLGRLPGAI
jgi:hypothetical protein